ncbi:MAG: hypothetical protein WDM92_13030 [Caulobacteraceae bacterium]
MTSLTHKFLLGVGLMTVAVTAFAAVAGFVVFQQQLEARELRYLQDYVSERVANEERRFSDLTSLHRAAADALAFRMARMTPADAGRRFDRYFPLRKDGTRRTPDAAFDGMFKSDGDLIHGMGGFIARGGQVSATDKAMFAAAFQVVAHTGEIVHREYDNFYFFTPDNRMVMFGPDRPDKLIYYRRDAPADLDISHEQMVEIITPAANPDRRTRCTSLQRLLQNTHGERLATACVTPVDLNGRRVGAFGSSIVLTGYFMQAIGQAMPGASNLIVSPQGDLIAYPGFATPGRGVGSHSRPLRARPAPEGPDGADRPVASAHRGRDQSRREADRGLRPVERSGLVFPGDLPARRGDLVRGAVGLLDSDHRAVGGHRGDRPGCLHGAEDDRHPLESTC